MFEINAEIINGRVYFSAQDLMRICEGSISDKGSPFDFALKNLSAQLKNMEQEALNNTEAVHESIFPENTEVTASL